jgi:hypothetical protein
MFVRFLSDYGYSRAGQCIELHDKFAAPLAPAIATPITAAEYQEYELTMAAIDREVERRVSAMPSSKRGSRFATNAPRRRVVTQDQWRRELGKDHADYWHAAMAHRQVS